MGPLVVSCKGGNHGGGAEVTRLGQQVITLYQELLQPSNLKHSSSNNNY